MYSVSMLMQMVYCDVYIYTLYTWWSVVFWWSSARCQGTAVLFVSCGVRLKPPKRGNLIVGLFPVGRGFR